MTDFKLNSPNDSIIKQFFQKYDIRAMYIEPCKNDYFKNYGNKISLSFNNAYLIESNHSLIFDYSDDELLLKDGVPEKHKIADRIFVF